MKIKLYSVNQETGEERFERECWTEDLDLDQCDYSTEHGIDEEIRKTGRCWIGGGAYQLFLAVKDSAWYGS